MQAESELADQFGVSMVTLRNATQALEQEGLVKRVSGVGVIVKDRREGQCIAVVNRETVIHPRPLYFHLRLVALMQVFFARRGWQVRSYLQIEEGFTSDGLNGLRDDLAKGRVAAVMWFEGDVPAEIQALADEHGACIVGGYTLPSLAAVDYSGATQLGCEALIAAGCERIACLFSHPDREGPLEVLSDVQMTFEACLRSAELRVEPKWIINHSRARDVGSGWQGFRDLWAGRDERPDGLLVLDDVLFRDAVRAIRELHVRIPEDLQIVTHWNKGNDDLNPYPVTRLEIDLEEIAQANVEIVTAAIAGDPPVRRKIDAVVVPPSEREFADARCLTATA